MYVHTDRLNRLTLRAVVFAAALLFSVAFAVNEGGASNASIDYAVALEGDYAVVGAQWQNDFQGAAYVLRRDGGAWVEEEQLVPDDLGRFDHFGAGVSIGGDRILVTAPWHDNLAGATYVFRRIDGRWIQDGKMPFRHELQATPTSAEAGITNEEIGRMMAYLDGRVDPLESISQDEILPPAWIDATDELFETKVEITWENVGLDAIVYKILRDGVLLSVVASEDSVYSDESGVPGVVYEYCVVVKDMGGAETSPVCDDGSRIIFAPTSASASDGQFDQFVRLSWTDRSTIEAGYYIRREGVMLDTLEANTDLYDDVSAVALVSYEYEILAFDDEDNRSRSVTDIGFRGVILPPLDVSASDGEYPDHVKVMWNDQAPNDTGYQILRDGVEIATTAPNAETYADSSALSGITYEYCVITRGAGGLASIPACDTGGVDVLPAPANVVATDSTLDDQVKVTWDDPTGLEDGFEIRRDGVLIFTSNADVTSYSDFDAGVGVRHDYCVRAVTEQGGQSVDACDDGVRSIVLPPTSVQAADGAAEDRVEIAWKSTSTRTMLFMIYRDDMLIKSLNSERRSYEDFGGTAGVEYSYSVTAVTSLEEESMHVSDVGRRELRVPGGMSATDEEFEDRIVVSWSDNSRLENGYVVYRDDGGTAGPMAVGETGPNRTSFTDMTAVPSVTYMYSVAAFDTLGEGRGESDGASDQGRRVLLAPTDVQATDAAFEDRVVVTWSDRSNAEDGYRIYRDGVVVGETGDNTTSFADLDPVLDVTSGYAVTAFDFLGESGTDSDSGSAMLLAPAAFNASDFYGGRVDMTWVDVSRIEAGYRIFRDGIEIGTTPANGTSYTDTGATPEAIHQYCIEAFNGSATSEKVCNEGRALPFGGTVRLDDSFTSIDYVDDEFGQSMAQVGDIVLVGAPDDSDGRGAAYFFRDEGGGAWTQLDRIVASVRGSLDLFGESVDLGTDADWAIIGAFGDDDRGTNAGAAYLFSRDGDAWFEQVKLFASDGAQFDNFGRTVAIEGGGIDPNPLTAIVGSSRGKVYVFTRENFVWGEKQILTPSDGAPNFGVAVAVDGDFLLVGAGGDCSEGAAYVFERQTDGTWLELQRLTQPVPDLKGFGRGLAIRGTLAVVGAPGCSDFNEALSAAYIFARSPEGAWEFQQEIVSADVEGDDRFGSSLSIAGDVVVAGAPGDDNENGNGAGSAYVFTHKQEGTWVETFKLLANDGRSVDLFGSSVVTDGNQVLSGAPRPFGGEGMVYVLETLSGPGPDPEPSDIMVTASDGVYDNRVRVQWEAVAGITGYRIYRDKQFIEELGMGELVYNDFESQPGRTSQYCVEAVEDGFIAKVGCDFGWKPPDGGITGRIATRAGAGVEGLPVCLDPPPARALLLDGTGGYIRVEDDDTFDFTSQDNFTVEVWVKYSGTGGTGSQDGHIIAKDRGSTQRGFRLHNLRASGEPGRLAFSINDGNGGGATVTTNRDDLNDDTWHHVAGVRDGVELLIYVDGTLDGLTSLMTIGDLTNESDLLFGRSGTALGTWFGGQLDDIRAWNVARTGDEIAAMRAIPLVGDEPGLLGYWPLDQGFGEVITDQTAGAHYGEFINGVYWTNRIAPLDICAVTDGEGNYVFSNVRYREETTFTVQPTEPTRQFEPAFKTITLNEGNPVQNEVGFNDISAYTVAGVVRFEGTQCFVPNVEIRVDGNFRGATDKNGKFAVPVDFGSRTIEAVYLDHAFNPPSITRQIDSNVAGLEFINTTIRTISGRVGGGCNHFIGDVAIEFRSEDGCLTVNDTTGHDYSMELPPQKYLARVTDVQNIPDGLVKSDILRFFENLGAREVDLTAADATLDFIYRAPLRVTIIGFPEVECDPIYYNGTSVPGVPILAQTEIYPLEILVEEDYGSEGLCAVDTGVVRIFDEIIDEADTPVELVIENGLVNYETAANTPNIAVGRRDSEGNDRSYQKALTVVAEVEGKAPKTVIEWVLVTGHNPRTGSFVTAVSEELPLLILRDPPGDGSSSFLQRGESVTTSVSALAVRSLSGAFSYETKAGMKFDKGTPFFTTQTKGYVKQKFGVEVGIEVGIGNTLEITTTVTEQFSTSSSDAFVGQPGDVFLGVALNLLFAKTDVIDFDTETCEIRPSEAVTIGGQEDAFETVYLFTDTHIRNTLIPQLEDLAALSPQDSFRLASAAENWRQHLALNESQKAAADFVENRSFSAGADFEFSETTAVSDKLDLSVKIFSSVKGALLFGFEESGSGGEAGFAAELKTSTQVSLSAAFNITRTVGYSLTDDDVGDFFSVDVKLDRGYATPVFDLVSGTSSCPWEPGSQPRDSLALNVTPPEISEVLPEEPATFTLGLANLSVSDETRAYTLRLENTSNPHGALVQANNADISGNGISFVIDPKVTQEITLTVERGPTRFNYPRLAVTAEPSCGDGALAKTVFFDVSFQAPCSDLTLFRPQSGWAFNKADEDAGRTVELILTDYVLEISESDSVEFIGAEYRRLGSGNEGPGEWTLIAQVPRGDIGEIETIIDWQPPVDAEDGVYELRAFTHCQSGRGFSGKSVGTIDRLAPLVLGTPEPADGELSFGEDISIRFNEVIDCGSIDPDHVTLSYVDGPEAGNTIPVETVCSGRTIVISPAENVDPNDLEGRHLEARVAAILDPAGNPLEEPAIWTFEVRQSRFTWSETGLTRDVAFRDPGRISTAVVNGTEDPVDFTITGKPDWITEIVPSTGTLTPGEMKTIEFMIREDIALGLYEGQVSAEAADTSQGVAVLDISLTVSCHEPVWSFTPSAFEHTMTIVAEVDVLGSFSADPNDRVAAFVGNQLRGVANLEPSRAGAYLAFLTTYSNRARGETLRFQIWDDDDCRLYNATAESFAFVSNDWIGTPESPITLTATDVLGDSIQAIPVNEGWTWISTATKSVDMSVTGILADLTPAPGDIIKSQASGFSQFVDPSTGWDGTLLMLDNVSGYMIKLSEPGTIFHTGMPLDTLIPVAKNWNWISYLPQGPIPVTEALADLRRQGILARDDLVKSQDEFAQWDGKAWFGNLELMEPGRGYKLFLRNATRRANDGSARDFFSYPSFTPPAAAPPVAVVSAQDGRNQRMPGAPKWSCNPYDYQYNMTVTATLVITGAESRDENDLVGAFVGDECRGVSWPVYVQGVDRHVVFLMIHSNEASGEVVDFRAFDADAKLVYEVTEELTYQADAVEGSVHEPLVFNAESVVHEEPEQELPSAFALGQNYPNPFNPVTTIRFELPEASHVRLVVYNALGQEVRTAVTRRYEAGYHRIEWDGKDNRGRAVASGIYFYKIQAGGFRDVKKMVLLR